MPKKTSEFPALPNDPEERYRILAYRLVNVRPLENMLMSGEHPAIKKRNETIGPAQEGLRQNVQPAAGVPAHILHQKPLPGS